MKKICLLIGLLTCVVSFIYADEGVEQNRCEKSKRVQLDKRFELGLLLPGLVDNGVEKMQLYKSPGFQCASGTVITINVNQKFRLEPAVLTFAEYMDMSSSKFNPEESGLDNPSTPFFSRFGLRIPVFANYEVLSVNNCILNVFGGPSLDWAVIGARTICATIKNQNAAVNTSIFNSENGFNRINLYIEGGFSYKSCKKDSPMRFSVGYGLLNQSKLPNTSYREWRVTFGYDL